MIKAQITNDDEVIEYDIVSSNLSIVGNKLLLELIVNDKLSIRYAIRADDREPNIDRIQTFIAEQLKQASSGNQPFLLFENLERSYIYIGPDDEDRQFSADKL